MCKVKGVRIFCACKDERCKDRHEFKDWTDTADCFIHHRGHGWEQYGTKILQPCQTGMIMIAYGMMEWKDERRSEVVKMLPHCGMNVKWEWRKTNEQGQARLCNYCNQNKHKVT